MSDQRTGDRVRFADDERLDKPDAEAMQTLGQEQLVRALGGLMGLASGCLTAPGFSHDGVSATGGGIYNLSTGFLAWDGSIAGAAPFSGADGRIVRVDTSLAWQSSLSVDLTGYSNGDTPVIWLRRTEVAYDKDTRKRWSVGSAAEESFNHDTRVREGVEFGATSSYSTTPSGTGWFPIARATVGASANATTFAPIPVWDGWYISGSSLAFAQGDLVGAVKTAVTSLTSAFGGDGGLARLLYDLRFYMSLIQDTDGASTWRTLPTRGLKQLDADLASAESDLTALEAAVGSAHVIFCGVIDQTAGTYSASGNAYGSVTIFKAGDGELELTPTLPAGWTLLGANVTVHPTGGAGWASAEVDGGVDINVKLYSTAPALFDSDFFITIYAKKP